MNKKQDGRVSYGELRSHCIGSGNTSRRVSHAGQTKKNLVYNDERRGTFNQFLQELSKMFLIFKDEGKPMVEEAKIRLLFEKINHSEFKQAIAALEIHHGMNTMSYTQITNHLVTKVSKLENSGTSKLNSRNLSSTNTVQKGKAEKGGPKQGGVHMPDGSVYTSFYPNWRELPEDKRQKVQSTREKKKLCKKTDSKVSEIKVLINEISSLKRSLAQVKVKEGGDTSSDEDINHNNVGTHFGGSNKKQKNK